MVNNDPARHNAPWQHVRKIGPCTLYLGDCRQVMAALLKDSVHAVVTDPPYGLSREPNMDEVLQRWLDGDDYKATGSGFMGKSWDSFVPGPATWKEARRLLKPGGHLAAFSGSRTYDLMATAIRLSGLHIRDQLMWLYGSGFPKSLDISKSIDKSGGGYGAVVRHAPSLKMASEHLASIMNACRKALRLVPMPSGGMVGAQPSNQPTSRLLWPASRFAALLPQMCLRMASVV